MHTCPTELADVVINTSTHRMLLVQRHVAFAYATSSDHLLWVAELDEGEMTLTGAELHSACEKADYIYATNSRGEKVTPTLSLV